MVRVVPTLFWGNFGCRPPPTKATKLLRPSIAAIPMPELKSMFLTISLRLRIWIEWVLASLPRETWSLHGSELKTKRLLSTYNFESFLVETELTTKSSVQSYREAAAILIEGD